MLYKAALKKAVVFCIILILFSYVILALPIDFIFCKFMCIAYSNYISNIVKRSLLCLILIILLPQLAFYGINKAQYINNIKNLWMLIPISTAAVLYFIYKYTALKDVTMPSAAMLTLYILDCLLVGIFEELLFRKIILFTFIIKWKFRKNGALLSVMVSSLFFSCSHLINLVYQPLLTTILQAVFALLTGIIFAAIVIKLKSILPVIIIHTIIDISGNMQSTFSSIYEKSYMNYTMSMIIIYIILIFLICLYLYILHKKSNQTGYSGD